MNKHLTSPLIPRPMVNKVCALLAVLLLSTGAASSARAQGEIASGTVSGAGGGPYTYSLSFSDSLSATSPIGSVWYAWVPGFFYLPSAPTSASAPAGWTASIVGNSIQFSANSAANDIAAGGSLSGFSYQANFSPAQLAAAPNSGRSVAYSGVFGPDGGNTFVVQPVGAPEPASLSLGLLGGIASWIIGRKKILGN